MRFAGKRLFHRMHEMRQCGLRFRMGFRPLQLDHRLCQQRRATKAAGCAQPMQFILRLSGLRSGQDAIALGGQVIEHQLAQCRKRCGIACDARQRVGVIPNRQGGAGNSAHRCDVFRRSRNIASAEAEPGKGLCQLLHRQWLGGHGIETLLAQALVLFGAVIGGQRQGGCVGAGVAVEVANVAQRIDAVGTGQVEVQQQHIETLRNGGLCGLFAVVERDDLPAEQGERFAQEGAVDRIIFGEQGMLHRGYRACGYASRMKRSRTVRKFTLFLLALLCASPLAARTLALEVERLTTPVARLDGLVVSLHWPEGATHGALTLKAATLDAGELGYRWRDLAWTCQLQQPAAETWQCAGKIKARGAAGLSLSARLDAGALVLEASEGRTRLALRQPLDADAPARVEVMRLPATWLAPLLAQAWEEGKPTAGSIDADWRIEQNASGIGFGGPVSFAGIGLDTRDGSIAAEGVAAKGRIQGQLAETSTSLELALDLGGGEFLIGPLYAQLPNTPVQFGATLTSSHSGRWNIDALRWRDPGVLEVQGRAVLDTAADSPLREADLRYVLAALDTAQARYFDSLVASLGFSGLKPAGSAQGELSVRAGDWQALDITLDAVSIEDGAGRFGVDGLSGALRLRQRETAVDSELSWRSAHVHGLGVGAATLPLRSVAGGLALRAPVSMPMLGGSLRLGALRYVPQQDDVRLDLSLALHEVNLGALSSAFGWPAFEGTISGELPGVRYVGDRLDFDGGLSASMFDGRVSVSQLSMERPFGVAPMLAASMEFSDLDMQPLTSAFGFGEITGRLDGHVRGLRLLDWEPIAFDAAFHTTQRRGERRRISQQAVRELTEVGGGGLAAGLQAQFLKAFSSFGYDRIGLSCVLANNVCTMGGAGAAANGGYVIVAGSGIPRVDVIGHQARVDWPVLVSRLKAATEGQMPVFD